MPPQTTCTPCTLTFPTRLALRSHIRHSDSHPNCIPCHRRFLNHQALATHLAESRFHDGPAPTPTTTGSARMGRRRRRRRHGRRESVDETARESDCGNFDADEKQTASTATSKTGQRASNLQNTRAFAFPFHFRRSPRRILPSRRLRALPRPVSAKRLVSAVVLQGPRYFVMLVLLLLLVAVVRWYCERFGCEGKHGCWS